MKAKRRITAAAWILIAVLGTASTITVQTGQKVVQVARGRNATLPCTYQTTASSKVGGIGTWKRFIDQAEAISRFFNQESSTGQDYTDRVAFTGNPDSGDLSIIISQVKMEDNGTYQCEVMLPQDRRGTPIDKLDLLVLVAPSKPKQSIAGTLEYGQVITLTCFSEEGSPVPTYTWQSYNVDNQLRQLPPTAVQDKGDLTLKNISADTSGFYIATVSNIVGKESCNITVAVMPPSMNIAFYAGIIGGSVAGIIVIGIVVYCCCCRDRDDKEDYEMAEREEGEQMQQEKLMRRKQDDDDDDDDGEEDEPDRQRAGPPMPPAHKPKMILNEVDA